MLIAVDLDGVLANSLKVMLDIFYERTGRLLRYEEIDDWYFWRKVNIDEETFFELLDSAWSRWREIPPTEDGIVDKLSRLRTLGRLDIVTARSKRTEDYALKWLTLHGIPYDNYIRVESGEAKAGLGYDVFIDDSPYLAMQLHNTGKLVLLYDQPWNRNVNAEGNVVRIRSLENAYHILSRMFR